MIKIKKVLKIMKRFIGKDTLISVRTIYKDFVERSKSKKLAIGEWNNARKTGKYRERELRGI